MSSDGQSMNCADIQRAVSEDPATNTTTMREHCESCKDCRDYRGSMCELDKRLQKAMRIAVPDLSLAGLPVLDPADNVSPLPRRRLATPAWLGLAAAFALAVVGGFMGWSALQPGVSLADEVVAHIEHEPQSLVVTQDAVPTTTVQTVLSKQVAHMDPRIGLITYARNCVIRGNSIPHLVIQGKKGPITLLLMPDEKIDKPIPVHDDQLDGVILPVGSGSIAVVGEHGEQIDRLGSRVVDAVKWST